MHLNNVVRIGIAKLTITINNQNKFSERFRDFLEYILLKLISMLIKLKVYFIRTYNDNMLMYENEHNDKCS